MNTIKIPEGVEELKISQESGRVVIEFVPKFKEGDFVYEDRRIMIVEKYPSFFKAMIYPPHGTKVYYNNTYGLPFSSPSFRFAPEEEKKILLDALEKDGKKWNAEKLCIEDIPQRKFKPGGWAFAEAWLEPYSDEPIVGELAIFWDSCKKYSRISIYAQRTTESHRDHLGVVWVNAIKFISKEQFEKHIKE